MQTPGRTTTGTAAVKPVSSQINLIGSFGIHVNVEPDEEVVIVPEAYDISVMSMTCCSKLGTTMGWKWFSRICEGQHQVELDPNVHNPPSRRLHYWRHHQRNFMIAHFQIQVPARAHHRLVTEATGQRATKHHEGDLTQDPIFTFTWKSMKYIQIGSVNDKTVEHGICIEDANCEEVPTDNSDMYSSGETVTDR